MTEMVVLLDETGSPIGTADKALVHTDRTPLHLAFSCHVRRASGEALMTRRALDKTTWPGVWTNAFCGHPSPGESFHDAIARRARDELGIAVSRIEPLLPDFRYEAVDASGVRENEVCPVFVAITDDEPAPNPAEVAEFAWADERDVERAVASAPWAFSPWLVEQLAQLADPARTERRATGTPGATS